MSAKRRERGAVPHARIVRDPKSPYWYAEFEVDCERFHKSTRQWDEAAARRSRTAGTTKLSPPPADVAKPA